MPIVLWIIPAALLALCAVLLVRALTFARPPDPVDRVEGIAVDAAEVAEHLSRTVCCETVSVDNQTPPDGECLLALHAELQEMYPLIHAHLQRQTINDYALLYTWTGTDPDLKPVLFAAHQDVVPADPSTLSAWTRPPFGGEIADGCVWGRGTMDNKNQIVAVMEAVESLLGAGYQPQRTVYLGFGHDEEIGGARGAAQIAAWLHERGIRLEAVLDEGGALIEGMLPGIKGQVAVIGTAEKGSATLELSVTCPPGHSAMPPRHTAIGILARAIARLEDRPMRARDQAIRGMMQGLGSALPFAYRLLFANLWLFGPLVLRVLGALSQTNAMIRTTSAATVVSGGIKDNILPREARAGVNYRLLTGDRSADVIAHAKRAIGDDRVQVQIAGGFFSEPSPVSPTGSAAYRSLERAIRQVYGNIAVAPYLVVGGTDARHYESVCEHIYRFCPLPAGRDDLKRIHGIDERIHIDDMARMVQFYGQLIHAWTDLAPEEQIK